MEIPKNKALQWYLDYEANLSAIDKRPYFPHPEDENYLKRADNRKEKKQLSWATQFAESYYANFVYAHNIPKLASDTADEIEMLSDICYVMIGQRFFSFSGATPSSIIVLTQDGVHVFTACHTISALGLVGLAASAIKNKGKKYTHDVYPIREVLSTYKTFENADFPYKTLFDFCKLSFSLIFPVSYKGFISECEMLIKPNSTLSQSNINPKRLSYIDEIKGLKELLDSGAITTEEYNTRKESVLNSQK